MEAEQAAEVLAKIPLFSDLNQKELGDVLNMCSFVRFNPGDLICQAGEAGDCMFVIAEGQAQVTVTGESGQPIPVATLDAGAILGELALIDDQPRSANVVATMPTQAIRIGRSEYNVMRTDLNPAAYKVLRKISLTVCSRLREVNASVSQKRGDSATRPGPGGAAPEGKDEGGVLKGLFKWVGRS